MLPRVILHNAVSVDGRIDGFTPDLGQFYELASRWNEDATVVGSNTLLKALEEEQVPEEDDDKSEWTANPDDTSPLLVAVDSRGRLGRLYPWLRRQPYWRDAMALCSNSTEKSYLAYLHSKHIDYIVAGNEQVDLRAALEELNTCYGVKVVRVDSGGTLNGVLLRAGLVDEISVVINPCLVGGTTPGSIFRENELASPDGVIPLNLIHVEKLEGEVIWLCYYVVKKL
jgi:2,5-diamino-6-(ribosylamino)-4(3H)-pyrimidinone 5'-phosphate reductase